jgi:hypothetical protein
VVRGKQGGEHGEGGGEQEKTSWTTQVKKPGAGRRRFVFWVTESEPAVEAAALLVALG